MAICQILNLKRNQKLIKQLKCKKFYKMINLKSIKQIWNLEIKIYKMIYRFNQKICKFNKRIWKDNMKSYNNNMHNRSKSVNSWKQRIQN